LALVHEQLTDFVGSLDEVPELSELLANQETESRVKADVIERVLGSADELVRNFVLLLVEKGRATEVREIAQEFDALVAAEDQVLDVDLTTAHELSKDEFERILGLIEKASGRKVQATRSVDEDLIGGIVLQAGSMRMDASVRGRLERLRQQLAMTRS
jgi:F-type H+-transporting ATPase subunit delta